MLKLGIGSTLGVGIYVIIGTVAAKQAGNKMTNENLKLKNDHFLTFFFTRPLCGALLCHCRGEQHLCRLLLCR